MSLELSGTTPAIKGVAGSVSAPALTGDDVDTGISFPSANTIKFSTNGVERMAITDSGVTGTGIGAGKILQVLQTVKTDTTSTQSTTFGNISGLSVAITPSSASSKILIIIDLAIGGPIMNSHSIRLARGSTGIYIGDAASNRIRASQALGYIGGLSYEQTNVHKTFLDSPNTTSETTYYVQWRIGYTGTFWLNKSARDTDNANYDGRSASSITVMEVGP